MALRRGLLVDYNALEAPLQDHGVFINVKQDRLVDPVFVASRKRVGTLASYYTDRI